MIIFYLDRSMVRAFKYKQTECNKNKRLVRYIDRLMIEKVHDITEILKDRNWVLKYCLCYSYDQSTINRPINRLYIILLRRPIVQYINGLMMIRK